MKKGNLTGALMETVDNLEPMENPRRASRNAALEALDLLGAHTHHDNDLHIASRLLALIATINGPGDDSKH